MRLLRENVAQRKFRGLQAIYTIILLTKTFKNYVACLIASFSEQDQKSCSCKSGSPLDLINPAQANQASLCSLIILFQTRFLLLFLHNTHGTKEIPDCENLVSPDLVGNLGWDNTVPYEPFRMVNTEPCVQFRKANTDPSV